MPSRAAVVSEGENEQSESDSQERDAAFEYDEDEGIEDDDEAMYEDDEDYDDPSFGSKKKKARKVKERREGGVVAKRKKREPGQPGLSQADRDQLWQPFQPVERSLASLQMRTTRLSRTRRSSSPRMAVLRVRLPILDMSTQKELGVEVRQKK